VSLRSPLSQAQGLGTARSGVGHWLWQRLSSVMLVPLVLWFAYSIAALGTLEYEAFISWVRSPMVTVMLLALMVTVLLHSALGLQVIVEDYVHTEWLKLSALVTLYLSTFLMAVAGVVAVLRIALGGAA
jgi:succinate dehydrogenase / fumarate reductase membrane anchor subunit